MYRRPDELDRALDWLSTHRATVLAGGTDVYPARVDRPLPAEVLDLTRIAALRGIVPAAGHWRIGALTTWTDVLRASLPPWFDALRAAAREVGGVQVQNRGTLGGNLCNASPAADGVPVLLAMDARVELARAGARRELPLSAFLLGARRTALAPDELLVAIRVPDRPAASRSAFVKLGHRRYLVISVAMVAATIDLDDRGRAAAVALAVGACAPVAQRLPALEAMLRGAPREAIGDVAAAALRADPVSLLAPLAPIDDVRGTADYRRDAVATLLVRALREAAR